MRLHLFEFEDLSWFPDAIRQGGTDYLRYFLTITDFYQPAVNILKKLLEETNKKEITDLCSGGGGSMARIAKQLSDTDHNISILLTDKFPNSNAFAYLSGLSGGAIGYSVSSVDAMKVPRELSGVRTMFSAVHHFKPDQVKNILKDAVDQRSPIALFDGGDKHLLTIFGIVLVQPLTFLIFTPFFRPFRFSRLIFTYLLPLIPLMTMWDGIVSVMRLYKPAELKNLAESVDTESYQWETGRIRNRIGMHVTYLTGRSIKQDHTDL